MPETLLRRKHVIGVTGNIACGKTAVLAMLNELGAETIDADALVHQLMGPGSSLAPEISKRFGPETIAPDGSVNRPALGQIVFSSPDGLADLENIVHPFVIAAMREAIHRPGPDVLVLDAIKLYEAGIADDCDEVWVVNCNKETQIKRIQNRNSVDRAEAERRIDAQPPQEVKVARADLVIENDGSLDETRRQVLSAWSRLTEIGGSNLRS